MIRKTRTSRQTISPFLWRACVSRFRRRFPRLMHTDCWSGSRAESLWRSLFFTPRSTRRYTGRTTTGGLRNRFAFESLEGRRMLAGDAVLDFAYGIGSSGHDEGRSVTTDSLGFVYVAGTFRGAVDFDPSPAAMTLISASGSQDIFVAKYTATGNLVWAKHMGGSGVDEANDIAVDGLGNVYITGGFQGAADFDPGVTTASLISTSGSQDIFVSKLDAAGNYSWAKRIGGSAPDIANSLAVDGDGNVYLTGSFQGNVDFDPGAGVAVLSSTTEEIFIAKLDANGNYVWANRTGATGAGNDIVTDDEGNVYTTGYFSGFANFNFGEYNPIQNVDSYDIFVSKHDTDGNYIWAKGIGGTSNDHASGIAIDGDRNVYITGRFFEDCDFDPGAGTAILTSNGSTDIFIAKLDANGNYAWAKNIGSTQSDLGSSIAADDDGNVYATGFFQGTVAFDPANGTAILTSPGGSEIFVSKFDTVGNYVWAKRLGGISNDQANGVALDVAGNIYVTGRFSGTADFDPHDTNELNLVSSAVSDPNIFLSKLTQLDVNFGLWTSENYSPGAGNWIVNSDAVTQTTDGDPSVYYGDTDFFGVFEATIRVATTSDDDFIGFVLGFTPGDLDPDAGNPDVDFLLVDWKQADQTGAGQIGARGLAVSRVTGLAASPFDFWGHSGVVEELGRALTRGNTGWADNVEYLFKFEYSAERLQVFVNGTLELDLVAPPSNLFPTGRIGFYSYSQQDVVYSIVSVEPPAALPTEITLDIDGNLVINDTEGKSDHLQLRFDSENHRLVIEDLFEGEIGSSLGTGTGTSIVEIELSEFSGDIIVNSLGGDDTLVVDSSLAESGRNLAFHGGDDDDAIEFVGDAVHTMSYTYASATSGSVALDVDGQETTVTTIQYTGLEPINSDVQADVVELIYTGGDETITLSNPGDANTQAVSTLGELTTFASPTQLLRIIATGGTDTINVGSLAEDYASIEIRGDGVSDVVNLNGTIEFAADHGLAVVDVGTINLPNAASDITTSGSGTVGLTAMRNIVLGAGSSIDTVDGGILLSANQQPTPTSGTFIGIDVNGGAIETSGTGAILVQGRSGDTGNNNYGIRLLEAVISSTALDMSAGSIELDGSGGSETSAHRGIGVEIASNSLVTSAHGGIQILGQGGGGLDNNYGVNISGLSVVSSTGAGGTAATITIDGTGGDGRFSNSGVRIQDVGTLVSSKDGDIQIVGQGGDGTGSGNNANHGVAVSSGAQVASTGIAKITIDGMGGDGTDNNHGVIIVDQNALVTSTVGDIEIIGQGGGNSSGHTNNGVTVDHAKVASTGIAQVTIDGTGGNGGDNNYGVHILQSQVTSEFGAILIEGQGALAGSGAGNYGVRVNDGQVMSTGTGETAATITIDGTGGDGANGSHYGVQIIAANALVTSVDGNIQITGQGGHGSSTSNVGVFVDLGAQVGSTGTAGITIDGTGGNGTIGNYGVYITGNSLVTSVDGNIVLSGAAGDGSGALNVGITLSGGAVLRSTGVGAEAATITVNGTGGAGTSENYGVRIQSSAAKILTADGNIQITGTPGTNGIGIGLEQSNDIEVTGSANVTLIADSMYIAATNAINAGTNTVTLLQETAGTAIALGGADSASQLGLTDAELDRITAGTIQIGDADSGELTVSGAINLASALELNVGTVNLQQNVSATGGLSGTASTINVQSTSAEIQDAIDIAADGAMINIAGGVYVGAISLDKFVQLSVAEAATATISGQISGANHLRKIGDGILILSNSGNDYTGSTQIWGGTLRLGAAGVIPDSSTIVMEAESAESSVFDLNDFDETVGRVADNWGSSIITLGSGTLTVTTVGGSPTSFRGVISGSGGLTIQGNGEWTLYGANTYDGVTSVNSGQLNIGNASALGSALGGTNVANGALLLLYGSDMTIEGESLTLNGGNGRGYGALENYAGINTWTGSIQLNATSGIGSIWAPNNLILSGPIEGPGGLNIRSQNGGIVTLSEGVQNTYAGTTTVFFNAILIVDGSITSDVVVNGLGTLGGTGTIFGNVEGAGTIAPGSSTGILTIDGDFTPTGTVELEVDGTTPGSDHDKLVVTGTATLSGATLDISLGYVPTIDDAVTLIDAGTLVGAFSNYDAGDLIEGGPLFIKYDTASSNVLLASNTAPIANGQEVEATYKTEKVITLTGSDDDNDPLTFIITALPTLGVLYEGSGTGGALIHSAGYVLSGNIVTYVANSVGSGVDAFKFKVNDGTDDSSAAAVDLDVLKRQLTIVATGINKTYDGTTDADVSLTDNRVAGDSLSITYAGADFENKHAGIDKSVDVTGINVTGAHAANYTWNTTADTTADILKLDITGSFTANSKIYDGNTSATVESTSLATPIALDDVTLDISDATFDSRHVADNRTVTANAFGLSGTDAGNYNLVAVNTTTADITPLDVTGSFTADDKTYDGNMSATVLTRSPGAVIGGDDVALTGGTAAFDTKDVGSSKTVTLVGAILTGDDAHNYNLLGVNTTTADIDQLDITGSFTANDKIYDGTAVATVNGTSLTTPIALDDVTLEITNATFADPHSGSDKTVTANAFGLTGADAHNYNLLGVADATADIFVAPPLVALAGPHLNGVGGVKILLNIEAEPADPDADEIFRVIISGVPEGATFWRADKATGKDLGGGRWRFTKAWLQDLSILVPVGFSGPVELTVTGISRQPTNGDVAQTSTPLTLAISRIEDLVVLGAEAGNRPWVQVVDQTDGHVVTKFRASVPAFTGGVRVAMADMTGDAIPEIITAQGPGAINMVAVFTIDGTELKAFRRRAYAAAAVTGGVNLAVGDVDGDGQNDIVVVPSVGQAKVHIFRNEFVPGDDPANPSSDPIRGIWKRFMAFPAGFTGGAVVAVADMGTFNGQQLVDSIAGDGKAEVIVGSGAGMRATIRVFNVAPAKPKLVRTMHTFGKNYTGGIASIDAGRVNNDLIPDIVVGAGESFGSRVRVLDGLQGTGLSTFRAYQPMGPNPSVRAAFLDLDADGIVDEIAVVQGPGGSTREIRTFDPLSGELVDSLLELDPDFSGEYTLAAV